MNNTIETWFAENHQKVEELSKKIFDHPEIASEEEYACRETADFMRSYGFDVETYMVRPARVENGITATWGSGHPVIGILGEYDALPGLGNEGVPYRAPLEGAGHGCGHCLMGPACAGAAVAVKEAMEEQKLTGTVKFFGCPAEEGLSGKVYMMLDGRMDDVDICIAYHDGGPFRVAEHICQSMYSAEFIFRGRTSHAACAPEAGRSALDAAQLMNMGVEFLREHIRPAVRIHYVFGAAGERPNVVPDFATLKYYVRSDNRAEVDKVFARVLDCARGAALMTGTKASYKIISGGYEPVLNFTLNDVLYEAAQKVPNIEYSEEDYAFARQLYRSYNNVEEVPELLDQGDREYIYGQCDLIPTHFCTPLGHGWAESGCSDVSDVSQVIPTVQLFGGGVMGVGGHSWGVTASSGSDTGRKAMIQAGKYMAQFCLEVFLRPEVCAKAKEEFDAFQKGKPAYDAIVASEGEIEL